MGPLSLYLDTDGNDMVVIPINYFSCIASWACLSLMIPSFAS